MSSRFRALTADQVQYLPETCRACVFWELPTAPRGPQLHRAAQNAEAKQLWVRSVELDSGPPGILAVHDNQTVGYAAYVPAEQARRSRRLGSVPSDDALVLTTLWVAPAARGTGLATAMLQRVLRNAHESGRKAVEATAARGAAEEARCILPESFLTARGFVVHHEHPRFPLLRLDLRQTARWQEAVDHAIEGVRAVLRRGERRPAPTPS